MGFLDTLRSAFRPAKAAPQDNLVANMRAGLTQPTHEAFDTEMQALNAGWQIYKLLNSDTDADWMEAFEENSRLRVPISAIADDLSVIRAYAVRRTATSIAGGEYQDDPAPNSRLQAFLDNPNPFFTFGQMLWLTEGWYDTCGKAPWRIMMGPDGLEAWPFPPNWINEWPSEDSPVWKINWFEEAADVPEEDIILFYRPKLSDPYRKASSLAKSVDNEIASDRAMGDFVVYSFLNEATPSVIVGVPGADQNALKEQQAKWTADRVGPRKARKALFVNGNVSVKEFKSNHKELEFNEGRRLTRDLILQAFGVPPERAGVLENSNRSTIDGADFQQQSKNVLPRANYFFSVLNKKLAPRLGREIIAYENPVKESISERRATAEMVLRTGAGTIDEARKMIGMPPMPNNAGRVIPVPVNNVRWYDPITREWIDPDPQPAEPTASDQNQPPAEPQNDPQEDQIQRLLDALGD